MSITSKKVQLSFICVRFQRLLDFGKQDHIRATNGSLKPAQICMKVIDLVLEMHQDPEIQRHLQESGGTLLDLILRAVKKYVSR